MAEKKMTNVEALTAAVALAEESGNAELTEKLTKMLETASKPRSKSKTLTAEQKQTLEMVEEAITKMAEVNEPVGTDWVMANVRYCTSSQRATAVMKKAIASGRVVKAEPVKGKVRYALA